MHPNIRATRSKAGGAMPSPKTGMIKPQISTTKEMNTIQDAEMPSAEEVALVNKNVEEMQNEQIIQHSEENVAVASDPRLEKMYQNNNAEEIYQNSNTEEMYQNNGKENNDAEQEQPEEEKNDVLYNEQDDDKISNQMEVDSYNFINNESTETPEENLVEKNERNIQVNTEPRPQIGPVIPPHILNQAKTNNKTEEPEAEQQSPKKIKTKTKRKKSIKSVSETEQKLSPQKEIENCKPVHEKKPEPVLEKKPEPVVEYISEYSSAKGKKKKPTKKNVLQNVNDQVAINNTNSNLDVTQQYYREVEQPPIPPPNAIRKARKEKPKCLTPSQIARIAKSYSSGAANDEISPELQAAWATLHQYWTHVQENPYDFDGWTYLLNHVETMDNIEAARSAFEGFLPLYPYCFAYWKKLSDLEHKFSDLETSLGVLYNGGKAVPFCCDIWTPLLNNFIEYAKEEKMSDDCVRGAFEFALDNVGLSFQSSPIWEMYLDYEKEKEDLIRVMDIYKRIINVPLKVYNKHWDHILAMIRDYHPRNYLSVNEYFKLKKHVSELMNIKFIPPPMVPPKHLLKTELEDPMQAKMKEKIVATLIPNHEKNEKEVDQRWRFEEKIKRPFFHVKPLEKKQLKNWNEYLDFEISKGDPVRIITLFERCLVPCAQYEEFWCKYAAYMETHIGNVASAKYSGMEYKPAKFRKDEEIIDAANSKDKEKIFEFWDSSETKPTKVSREIRFEVMFLLNRLSKSIGVSGKVLYSPSLTPISLLQTLTYEDVRQIYRRAAWIHCPNKPLILMQWAEFEEAQGDVQTARDLLNSVIQKNNSLLSTRLQLIELERRNENYDRVEELYAQTFATYKDNRIKSCIAIKYARFLFKIQDEVEKSLMILRKALKKDKTNVHLYHHVFDICYQRKPVDVDGVLAACMLAIASKDMPLEEKNWFCIKRLDFLKEHGNITQFKKAKVEALHISLKFEAQKQEEFKKIEEAKKKEEEEKQKELELQLKAEAEKKALEAAADEPIIIQEVPLEEGEERENNESNKKSKRKHKKVRREKGEIREHRSKRSRDSPSRERDHSSKRRHEDPEATPNLSHPPPQEVMYDSQGKILYDPQTKNINSEMPEGPMQPNMMNMGDPNMQGMPLNNMGMQHQGPFNNSSINGGGLLPTPAMGPLGGFQGPSPQQLQQMNSTFTNHLGQPQQPPTNNQAYHNVAPDWENKEIVSSNYGYGNAHPIAKEQQNNLYNKYYDMVSKRFEEPPPKDVVYEPKNVDEAIGITAAAAAVANVGRNPNSYLPPPPVPSGILGDSLFNFNQFNQARSDHYYQKNTRSPMNDNLSSRGVPPPLMTLPLQEPPKFVDTHSHLHRDRGFPMQFRGGKRNAPLNKGYLNKLDDNFIPPKKDVSPPPVIEIKEDEIKDVEVEDNEAVVLSSGRNAIDVSALLKKARANSIDVDKRKDETRKEEIETTKIVSSGRNTVNVLALMRDRKNSIEHSNQHNQSPVVPAIEKPLVQIIAKGPRNLPGWLINDGGELTLSNTSNGDSILRYWPRYMNENGHKTLFASLRKSVKWHQRRYKGPNEKESKHLPKLVSWVGPCDYEKDGIELAANTSWPSEIVELLHRLIRFSSSSFNSCFLSLYTNGYSYHPMNTDRHMAMENHPTIAKISLGATRKFEMKRIDGSQHISLPLMPGSLLILEGATQDDWLCHIPKEPEISDERISLSFGTMLMIKGVTY